MDLILLLVPLGFIVCLVTVWAIGSPKLSLKTALIGISFVLFMALCVRIGIKLGENSKEKPASYKENPENQFLRNTESQTTSKISIKKNEPPKTLPHSAPGENSRQTEETRIITTHNNQEVLEFRNDFMKYLVIHNDHDSKEEEKEKAWKDFCLKWKVPLDLGASLSDAVSFYENFEQGSLKEWAIRAFNSVGTKITLYPEKTSSGKPSAFSFGDDKIITLSHYDKTRGNILQFLLDGKIIMAIAESKPIPFDKNRKYELSALAKSSGPVAHINVIGYRLKPGLPAKTKPLFENLEEIAKSGFVQFKKQDESEELLQNWPTGTAQFPDKRESNDNIDQIDFVTVKITVFSGEPGDLMIDNVMLQRTYNLDTE